MNFSIFLINSSFDVKAFGYSRSYALLPVAFFLSLDLWDNTFKSKVIVFSSSKDNSNNLLVFDEGMKKMVDSLFSNTKGKKIEKRRLRCQWRKNPIRLRRGF